MPKVIQPFGSNLEENLAIYDNLMRDGVTEHTPHKSIGKFMAQSEFGTEDRRAGNRRTSPLRKTGTQHDLYSEKAMQHGSTPYPRGPRLDETTGVHGSNPFAPVHYGPMSLDDEREMVQLFFDVIQQEVSLEQKKQALVEFADFNLMDGF